jgi:hypothetical protein
MKEKREMLKVLTDGHSALYSRAQQISEKYFSTPI